MEMVGVGDGLCVGMGDKRHENGEIVSIFIVKR